MDTIGVGTFHEASISQYIWEVVAMTTFASVCDIEIIAIFMELVGDLL